MLGITLAALHLLALCIGFGAILVMMVFAAVAIARGYGMAAGRTLP